MTILKIFNLGLKFLLELALMAVFGYWGYTLPTVAWEKIGLSVLMIGLFVVVWAIFMAPRSSRRLHGLWYHLMDLVILLAAVLALVDIKQLTMAMILMIVYLANKILLMIWPQSPPPDDE